MGNKRIPFLPNKYYHVYNHGNGQDTIFKSDENYLYFLKKYSGYLYPIIDTYAYCLMPNHFHFLIKVRSEDELKQYFLKKYPAKNPQGLQDLAGLTSMQFGNFLNAYTKAFNIQQGRVGSLFRDNLKRKEVCTEEYFSKLIHYIHYNPVHHGFTRSIESWEYSSYHSLISEKKSNINREKAIGWFGSKEHFVFLHKRRPEIKSVLEMDF